MIRTLLTAVILCSAAQHLLAHDTPACPGVSVQSSIDGLNEPVDFKLSATHAYVLNNAGSELLTIDISSSDLTPTHALDLSPATYTNLMIHDGVCYLSSGTNSIQIIDLTVPSAPSFASSITTIDPIVQPTIIDNLMYAGVSQIFDLQDPLNPQLAGSMSLPSPIAGGDNEHIYTTQLQRVDLSNPLTPIVLLDPPPFTNAQHTAIDIDLDNNRLYAVSNEFITVRDISAPSNPIDVYSYEFSPPFETFPLYLFRRGAMLVSGGNITTDIRVVDYSAPSGYTYMDYSFSIFEDFNESVRAIRDQNGSDYILSDTMLTRAQIETDGVITTAPSKGPINTLRKHNNLLIAAEDNHGISIYDATEPRQIRFISSYSALDTTIAADMKDGTFYIAADRQDLVLVDLTDPTNPTLISTIETGFRTRDVRVHDDTLFVVNRSSGLLIYDISTPTSPTLRSSTPLVGWNDKVDFNADHTLAVVTSGPFDTYLIDITDLDSPSVISTITPLSTDTSTPGINSASFHAQLLYTAEHDLGYRVWDITNPATPTLLAHHDFSYTQNGFPSSTLHPIAYRVQPQNNQLLIANGNNGFVIYNNADPMNPSFDKYYATEVYPTATSSVRSFAIEGGIAFTGVYGGGIKVYNLANCPPCIADFNFDGELNFFDVSAFLVAYLDEDPRADLNSDNVLNFYDVSFFISSYSYGCP